MMMMLVLKAECTLTEVCPPKFFMWKPQHLIRQNVTVFEDKPFKEVTKLNGRQRGGVLSMAVPLSGKRETHRGCTSPEERPCEDSEESAVFKPERALKRNQAPDTLILDFPPRELCEINYFCCLSPPNLCCFVMIA